VIPRGRIARWPVVLFGVLLGASGAVVCFSQEPVDAETCGVCHDEIVPQFIAGPHGKKMAAQSEELLAMSCEACHGSAEAHVDDPSPENIVRHPGPEACLRCHPDAASKMELLAPAHNRHRIACLDCHDSGHGDAAAPAMLADEPRELCSSCHRQEAAAFLLPYAHRDGLEPFQCVECHSLHGDNRVGRVSLLDGGAACTECHTGQTRPFIYPHPPQERLSCMACHEPHGSTNPRQLVRRDTYLLCLECHTAVPSFHDITGSRYRDCVNCHSAVHGSNRDPRLFQE
jgi:DmsE family decaheme c-type cytochrome